MTPLQNIGIDSGLASQLAKNSQTEQPNTQTQNNQNILNTQTNLNDNTQTSANTINLEKEIQKAIEQLTQNLSYLNTHLNISIDKKADSIVIKIIDNKTNQVIKEIPPEYMLRIAEAINNLVGIIVNKKV